MELLSVAGPYVHSNQAVVGRYVYFVHLDFIQGGPAK